MGDEEARSLGVDVRKVRAVLIAAARLVSTLTVVLAGVVARVGLVVPHLVRLAIGPDDRTLLPASALRGATYLLLVDDLSRSFFAFELLIGIAGAAQPRSA
jgi:iron complex transport system permease protein